MTEKTDRYIVQPGTIPPEVAVKALDVAAGMVGSSRDGETREQKARRVGEMAHQILAGLYTLPRPKE